MNPELFSKESQIPGTLTSPSPDPSSMELQPPQQVENPQNNAERRSFQETLQKGSRTFSWASLFFSHQTYEQVLQLYAWCRACDDITDGSQLGWNQNPRGLPADRVTLIWEQTLQAYHSPHIGQSAEFQAFGRLMKEREIPLIYAQDLIEGMRHDALELRCNTLKDLFLYCYRVAGVVGLMMTYLMGLKHPRALKNAVSLGIALQLTNIIRDIGDDFRVGRLYIPMDWLSELQIDPQELLEEKNYKLLEFMRRRLSIEAHRHYQEGLAGLIDLPFRAALAVSVAAHLYRAIGDRVIQLGTSSFITRTTLRTWDRLQATSQGILFVLLSLPSRIKHRRPLLKITEIWRPT